MFDGNTATVAPWKCLFCYYTHSHTPEHILTTHTQHTRHTLLHVDQGLITVTPREGRLLPLRRAAAASGAALLHINIPAVWNASPSGWPGSIKAFLSPIATGADFLSRIRPPP